eukprot:1158938-Pelagomonas_calceolata.AAC.6
MWTASAWLQLASTSARTCFKRRPNSRAHAHPHSLMYSRSPSLARSLKLTHRDAEGLYVGFKELSYCTLRAQLLMALHDDNSAVATRDACHELAWTLDAGIMNGQSLL